MKNVMEFGDHSAVISYDPEIQMFRGEFVDLNGGADFYADNLDDLRKEEGAREGRRREVDARAAGPRRRRYEGRGPRDEGRRDHEPKPERLDESEQQVAGKERRETSGEADADASKPPSAGAVRPNTGGHAGEQRQRIDGKVEQETADDADGGDAGENANDNHGGGLRERSV